MIITALQQKGNNVLVCFDDGEFITLDYRTVTDNALRKSDVLDEKKIEQLISESGYQKAKDSAFRFLGMRHHSTSELRTKLIKKKYPKDIIEKILIDLTDKKLLDDEQFAEAFLEERSVKKKIGINKLKAELFKKGINRNIIEKTLLRVDHELSYDQALELAKRKIDSIKRKETDKRKIKAKLYSSLSSRGFESDLIMKVLNEVLEDFD
ncbi:MAG: regulatory protein RecX [Ignavibacteriales bacterium]|nr:MAG: regulatory protein RecX [Ignavibacteriales bacterium]